MTSAGTTWGNFRMYEGIIISIFAIQNIILLTFFSKQYIFLGTLKIVAGTLTLILILLTITTNDYTWETEHSARILSFFNCIILILIGILFIGNNRKIMNNE